MKFFADTNRGGALETDEQLFLRIKDSDAGALKVLFERYYPALCWFSESIVKSAETAEETVSDVFAELWLKRATIELRSKIKPYLYTAVKNRSLNAVRSSGCIPEPLDTLDTDPAGCEFDADGPLLYNELKLTIEALIERMPERRRRIFRMTRIDGLSYQETAEILSLSVFTVQNQMVEAVKFLARNSHLPL
jgi:RNA polymerase sigma-70 factor, ECF subfamily